MSRDQMLAFKLGELRPYFGPRPNEGRLQRIDMDEQIFRHHRLFPKSAEKDRWRELERRFCILFGYELTGIKRSIPGWYPIPQHL